MTEQELCALKAIRADIAEIRKTQLEHVKDIAKLKIKTGLWSALVSAAVAIVGYFWR